MKGIWKVLSIKWKVSDKNKEKNELGHRLLATHMRIITTTRGNWSLR
ncbi:hypothetical protein CACET_c14190 [Clostridium aceticum]|uniref:Uncharacterized protein n=1 Tax=Clostridium aceticum TaxID=84022 RepID=A0A0G3W951_9CLOT|nr:hypothetical protein [Clostridium aceticum]AKL94883.1 hypothetical protein CACET_c14190 [Clostridium aceticum]